MANEAGGSVSDFRKMGQAAAGKNTISGSPALSGLDQVTEALRAKKLARETENKAIKKEQKDARKKGGQKISNAFEEMGPTLKALGPESFGKAQEEIKALREEYFPCVDAKDQECIARLNMKLNDIKSRHANDAENLTNLVESWEDDTVSTDAMTEEEMAVMENFASNPTKRVVYDENNTMMYEWDVPVMKDGEPVLDKEGNPVTEAERYSMTEMQDMIITKQTENGVKVLDYGEELKQAYKDGSPPSDAKIKSKIRGIIPEDARDLRDWLHGNPAEQDGLDVHGYLTDLMSVDGDFNTFSAMGVDTSQFEDTNGIAGIQADEIPDEFKEELIRKIMDVDDPEMSHSIISDIYANLLKNNMVGEVNKDYRPQSETSILGSKIDSSAEAVAKRKEALVMLKSLEDPTNEIHTKISAMDEDEIATFLGFENLQSQIYNDETQEMESIETYIASATKKKAATKGKTAEDYKNMLK